MKQELKDLMEELQMAFNQTVCESERVAEVLADIKRSGYDVLLALEVTIGVTATKQNEEELASAPAKPVVAGEFAFSEEDQQFLRDLHICVE